MKLRRKRYILYRLSRWETPDLLHRFSLTIRLTDFAELDIFSRAMGIFEAKIEYRPNPKNRTLSDYVARLTLVPLYIQDRGLVWCDESKLA